MNAKRTEGFTLIEVMIAMVLIAILTAVALPSYQNQVAKGRRADAQGIMMGFAQAMEKHYATNNYSYLGAADGGGDTGKPDTSLYPSTSPTEGDNPFYNLTISAATTSSYTLRATPTGSQAGDGIIEVNSLGQRFWDKNNDGDVADAGENNWQSK